MQFNGVMITDGGPHPAEKWATVTAAQLFQIDQKLDGSRLLLAQRTQLAIAEALLPHHANAQSAERDALTQKGDARLAEPHDPIPAAIDALDAVVACMRGTPWEEKTADPEWKAAAGSVLASHFATSADIERQWHVSRNQAKG